MKNLSKISLLVIAYAISFSVAQAQSANPMGVNENYKHQFPTSKGNKFKNSLRNDNAEDVSIRNYKRQVRYTKTENGAFSKNFINIKKTSTVNSKHPYGL